MTVCLEKEPGGCSREVPPINRGLSLHSLVLLPTISCSPHQQAQDFSKTPKSFYPQQHPSPMRTFTNLMVPITAAVMASVPAVTAVALEKKDLNASDSHAFLDSECGTAIVYELPVSLEIPQQTSHEWCCDVSTPCMCSRTRANVCA